VKLAPPGIGQHLPREALHPLQLDLVRHGDGLPLAGQEHEQPAGTHPAPPQHPLQHGIEPAEIEEQPSIHAGLGQRFLELGSIDHS